MGRYTTPYVTGDNLESVIKQLEQAAKLLFQWFSDNQMKGNEDMSCLNKYKRKSVCKCRYHTDNQ